MWNKLPDWMKFLCVVAVIATPAQIIDAYEPALVIPVFFGAGLIAIAIVAATMWRRFIKEEDLTR